MSGRVGRPPAGDTLDQKWNARISDLQKSMDSQFASIVDLLKRGRRGDRAPDQQPPLLPTAGLC